ncbi:MAG: PAS domain-containing protein [Bacteroidetes bacterium]|nr:PAS domain-containing protein [Bacteroidota bacterium]
MEIKPRTKDEPQNKLRNSSESLLLESKATKKSKLLRIPKNYATGIIVMLAGIIVLIGWQLDSNILKTFGLGGVTMKANSAVFFILAGLTLIFLQVKQKLISVHAVRLLAGIMIIFGSLVVLQYLFNIDLGIDEYLFREKENALGTVHPGRPAPNTVLNFILIGLLFLLLTYPKFERSLVNIFLLITTFTISIMGLSGYILGLDELTGFEAYTRISFADSLTFIIVCAGIYLLMFTNNRNITFEYKLLSGLTVASIFIIFGSLLSATSIKSLVSASHKVEHTKLVQEKLGNALSETYRIVANSRGFLISGNEVFLNEWFGTAERIFNLLEEIKDLTKDNPKQQARLMLLEDLGKNGIEFSSELINTYKNEGRDAAFTVFSTLNGKVIYAKTDSLIKEMAAEEKRILIERTENEEHKALGTLLIILINLFMQIILLIVVFWLVKKDITGRRKAEAALQKLNKELEERVKERIKDLNSTNDMLEKTGKMAKIGGWIIDLRNNEVVFSEMVRKIHEVGPDYHPTIETGLEFYTPESIPVITEAVRLAIEDGKPFDLQLPLITAKNNRIWVRTIGQPQIENGEIVAVSGIFQDVTDRISAEIEAKETNIRFNNLVSSLNDVVWTASGDGSQIIDINKSFETLYGRTVEEFKANPKLWIEMVHPDDLAIAEASSEKLLSKGSAEAEYRIIRPDGKIVWLLDRKSLIYDENGKPVQIGGVAKDITQQQRLKIRKLKQSEILEAITTGKKLPDILELIVKSVESEDPASICSILLLDEEGKHLHLGAAPNLPDFYNQAIDGLEIGEYVGSCGAAVYSRKRVIAEDIHTHPNWIPFRALAQKANLQSCWSDPILDAKGNALGTFAIYHSKPKAPDNGVLELMESVVHLASLAITRNQDEKKIRDINAGLEIKVQERTRQLAETNEILHTEIEERKKIEEELKKAKREAERANLAKSEFLSRMSHELRTPMNSILGFAQLLEMGELAPAHIKGVNHILKSGKHLLNLINEVLDLSRIEAGELSVSLEPISVCGITTETLDIVLPLANDRNISLEFINLSDEDMFVKADNQKLKQVLLNLINNAVKYNRDGGSVKVQCSKENGVRISVIDTGNGIKPEELHKLFMPFQRIGAEVSAVEGTGLGLAVAKKLIEVMSGTVGVESKVGVGSIFWIELPQAEGQNGYHKQNSVTEKTKAETANSVVTGTILYIEDNISNIQLVEQILDIHRPSIHLITEMYGKNTVKLATDYKPALILLDLDLPDINGKEVLKLLKNEAKTKTIPVVILSANAMGSQIEKLKEAGAANYLTKPLDVLEFLEVVDGMIKPIR